MPFSRAAVAESTDLQVPWAWGPTPHCVDEGPCLHLGVLLGPFRLKSHGPAPEPAKTLGFWV